MASLCCKLPSVADRSKTLLPLNSASKAPSLRRTPQNAGRSTLLAISRGLGSLGCVESMLPLHTAIAVSRLLSNIGVNSAFWSCLSQGLALPL